MNKKGIFTAVLAIFTLVIFTFAYYKIVFAPKTNYREVIGQNQVKLYESYIDGEKIALYIDESAKQAAYSAILDLAGNGGYSKDVLSDCGNVVGYNIWYINGKECYPKNLKDRLSKNFVEELDKYLANYEVILFNDENIKGLRDFFNIHVDDGDKIEIYGKSREKYIFGVKTPEEYKIKYEMNPDFKQEINYNFGDYNELKIIMAEPIRLCKSAECFNRVIDKKNYDWEIVDRDEYVLFKVNTKKKIFNDDVVVKFAIRTNP